VYRREFIWDYLDLAYSGR